jgi:hypothetical protein
MPGTVPTQKETIRVTLQIDSASGLLWQDGCAGPEITQGFFDLSQVDASFPAWQAADADWGARAAKGVGVRGGPEGTRTSYFYSNSFAPFGRTWGAPFAPTELCPVVAPPVCDPFVGPCPPPCDPYLGPCQPPCDPSLGPCQPPCDPSLGPCPLGGVPLATVPVLECMSFDTARATLASAGYAVGNVKPGNAGPDFVVADSRPRAGTSLPAGNSVDLTLRERSKVPGCG